MKIGAQMYSIRKQCQTPEEIRVALLKLSDIGYRCAQLSGCGPIEAERLRQYADEAGISIDLSFVKWKQIVEETDELIRWHKTLGAKWIGMGILPKPAWWDLGELENVMDSLEEPIRKITDAGLRFSYHNHALEYYRLDGKIIFDRLLERFSPEQMGVVLDTYWVQKGGADVLEWIDRLKGRLDCVHLKDYEVDPDDFKLSRFAVLGRGSMNFPKILRAFVDAGAQYAYVEQDECYGEDPFDCLKESFLYLRALGYC